MIAQLTSKDNSLLKRIRLVASQARRAPEDLVLAEGIRSIEEAAGANRRIEAVLFMERFGSSERESALLRTLSERRINLYRISERLMESVSDVQTPQGVLALVRVPLVCLKDWTPVRRPLILCACGLQDPGNLGTLIRSAAAAGVSLVCLTPGTVSPRIPKVIRASAGAFFRLPVIERVDFLEFLVYCHEHSITPYLADAHAGKLYSEVDYTRGAALLLGNEARGLENVACADVQGIHIPMAPGVESLNVGIAGALVLFEAFRQRTAAGQFLAD